MSDTIIALASGNAKAGVSVIRCSGPNAYELAKRLSGRESFSPRFAHFCKFAYNGELIDTGLCLFFPSPNSFTGEDVIEFQLHGSHSIIRKFMDVAVETGLTRLAEAGEFSRRAFLNNKMDLSQAEGLIDLIDAETEAQRKQALRIVKGELGNKANDWRERIIEILAESEAYIDFPDEDLPDGLSQENKHKINDLINDLDQTLSHFRDFQRVRDGFSIVIIGPPNAGKSSLLNSLCGREAAIVSSIAGTTRDIVEVSLNLQGYLVHISDTAGLREANDTIEQEGIRRALERCESADLIIGLVEDIDQYKAIAPHLEKDSLLIWTKADLFGNDRIDQSIPFEQFLISVRNKSGLENLIAAIIARACVNSQSAEFAPITRLRHKIAIENAIESLNRSLSSSAIALELGSEDLRHAAFQMGAIIGKVDIENLLDKIFSSFCIGK